MTLSLFWSLFVMVLIMTSQQTMVQGLAEAGARVTCASATEEVLELALVALDEEVQLSLFSIDILAAHAQPRALVRFH